MEATQSGAEITSPAPSSVEAAAQKINGLFKAEPEKAKPKPEVEAEQNSDVEAEASAESSDTDTEGKEEGQEASETSEDADNSEAETLTTLSAVAQKLGLDESKLYDLKLKTKVDGVDGEATLAQLVKGYQSEGHLTRKSMELSDLKKEAEKRIESIETERQQRIGTLEQAAQVAQRILLGEYNSINWDELRKSDSIGYLEKKNQFEEYNHSLNQINAAIQAERQKDQGVNQEKLKAFVKEQQDKLVNALPEWKEPAVQKKQYSELLDYLRTEFQVSKEEIDGILDHRFYLMAIESKKYRDLQKKNPRIENKDRTPPKVVKAGSGNIASPAAKTSELKKSFAQRKDVKSAGALINSLIKR